MPEDLKLVEMLRDEMRSGFKMLAEGISQTNEGIAQTNSRLDQTNARLDQNIARLDESILELREFKQDVSNKLDGISSFLLRSEEFTGSLATRLDKVERRLGKLEKRDKSA